MFGVGLRALAYARRGVRALESIAKSLDSLAKYDELRWGLEHGPKPPPRPMELGEMNVAEVNENYRKQQIADGFMTEDDEPK